MKKIFFLIAILISTNALAFIPEDHLSDQEEARARELFLQVKCPVCEGQVIESSETEISFELRKLIREKIREGKSNEDIKSYLRSKFGDDVVISPQLNSATFFLWFLPLIFVASGLFLIFRNIKKT